MKKRKVQNVRRLAVGLALIGLLSFSARLLPTIAWFHAQDSRSNHLYNHPQKFHVTAVDDFVLPGSPLEPGGDIAGKHIGATNQGTVAGLVRLLAFPEILAEDGATILPSQLDHEVLVDLDQQNWANGGDGFYYYLHRLEPGETTPSLFTQVQLAAGLPDIYKNATLRIVVKSEAVETTIAQYRMGWWGSTDPPTGYLLGIDDLLKVQCEN